MHGLRAPAPVLGQGRSSRLGMPGAVRAVAATDAPQPGAGTTPVDGAHGPVYRALCRLPDDEGTRRIVEALRRHYLHTSSPQDGSGRATAQPLGYLKFAAAVEVLAIAADASRTANGGAGLSGGQQALPLVEVSRLGE